MNVYKKERKRIIKEHSDFLIKIKSDLFDLIKSNHDNFNITKKSYYFEGNIEKKEITCRFPDKDFPLVLYFFIYQWNKDIDVSMNWKFTEESIEDFYKRFKKYLQ